MKRAFVIGYPITHSVSPAMHNAAFQGLAIDAAYEAVSVPPEELKEAVERLRAPDVLGANVTVPHKQAVMPLLDEIENAAEAIGAVNTVVNRDGRLIGYNTDKPGFLQSLRGAGCDPRGMRVLILGAGGSERAVALGLVEAGTERLALAGRRRDRVALAAAQLKSEAGLEAREVSWDDESLASACSDADLIVNCTPVGMRSSVDEGAAPLPAGALRPGTWVCDLVYNPQETPLLRLALQAGARPIGGLGMLVYQAAAAFELWTGREAPVDIMTGAAAKALAEQD